MEIPGAKMEHADGYCQVVLVLRYDYYDKSGGFVRSEDAPPLDWQVSVDPPLVRRTGRRRYHLRG